MTSNTSKHDSRPSFARIVAMPPPPKPQSGPVADDEAETTMTEELKSPPISHTSSTTLPSQPDQEGLKETPADVVIQGLENGVESLSINGQNGSEDSQSSAEGRATGALQTDLSFDDDQTHLSNSSTKPTSFDSKSMASVTTFAMDEKDSLRPDDSASVQAADEEESLSGAASVAANSRTGSEAGTRGFRDASSQRIRGLIPTVMQRFPNGDIRAASTIPPDSVSNNFVVNNQAEFQPGTALNGYPLEPDEKLLEAMSSPKDRLLLLQLEEKIRDFIQDSKEQSLELPPSNAFGRLLAHKLGDYYHLTHFVDNNATSVRLHRTPFCRLPTPLSLLRPDNSTHTPSSNAPAMKIMRRNDQSSSERPSVGGSTAASSSAPSKPASEVEGDGFNDDDPTGSSTGATPAKERSAMTREEREAKYQEARERIFRDFPESKTGESPNGDTDADMSRSSSASGGRKKNFRQRTPHDDSFEARSQFNAYYPGVSYSSGTAPVTLPNAPAFNQHPYMVGPGASPPNMNYPHGSHTSNVYPNMHNVPQYPINMPHMGQSGSWQSPTAPQQSPYSGYAVLNPSTPMMGHAQTRSPQSMNNYGHQNFTHSSHHGSSTWTGQAYQNNYAHSPQRNGPMQWSGYPSTPMTANTGSYPYGQPSNQHYPSPGQSMVNHPVPGSFNRPTFNPQTRSFVPGGNSTTNRYPNKGMLHNTNVSYGNPQMNNPQQWTGYMDNNGQPMANTPPMLNNRNHNNAAGPASRVVQPGNNDSIAKWGTPAHLPPKPPPSEVSSEFDVNIRNPPSISTNHYATNNTNIAPSQANNGPLVVSGGTSVSKST